MTTNSRGHGPASSGFSLPPILVSHRVSLRLHMSPSKLHLKRTPAEQAEHDWKKAKRAAKKAAKRARREHAAASDDEELGDLIDTKRRRTSPSGSKTYGYVFDSDIEDGLPPPSSHSGPSSRAHKSDFESIRAEIEEQRFREKMWGAFEDDERLDAMEAEFNDYAHVPRRWRSSSGRGTSTMDYEATEDPQVMDDEEYAEWIRAGMWRYVFADMRYLFDGCYSFPHAHCRKKHAAEFEEQERKKAEREARHAQEEAIRAETRRLA